MLKVMWLMKRRAGTTLESAIDYYENIHSVLAKDLFERNAFRPLKYMRRYFRPITNLLPLASDFSGSDFDFVMEMWFEDEAHFQRMLEISSPEEIWQAIVADERRFLDPNTRAIYILEEHETTFGP